MIRDLYTLPTRAAKISIPPTRLFTRGPVGHSSVSAEPGADAPFCRFLIVWGCGIQVCR